MAAGSLLRIAFQGAVHMLRRQSICVCATCICRLPMQPFAKQCQIAAVLLLSFLQARTVPGTGIVISKLNADFLDSSGRCATIPASKPTWQLRLQPVMRAVSLLQQLRGGGGGTQTQTESAAAGASYPATTAAAVAAAAAASGSLRSRLHAVGRALRFWVSDGRHQMQHIVGGGGAAAIAKARDAGAPCLFKFRGKWYLLAAQQAGW